MTVRTASCRCGLVTARCEGEPVRISVCHCLECQKRSGSAFAAQARWPEDQVTTFGETRSWDQIVDSGNKATFHFCPTCGSTLFYMLEKFPGVVAVAIGAFADPNFPPPRFSVWEERKHDWVTIGGNVEHSD